MPRAAMADARSLSDLLSGLSLSGQSWCYSDLGKHTGFSVPPGEALLFHAVLHGSVRFACASGEVAELRAGDAVMVLSGEAHALRTAPGSPASTHPFLREGRSVDVPATLPLSGTLPVCTRILSGRLRIDWPVEVARSALPSLLRLGEASGSPAAALLKPEALALAGMGGGSAALLTRLASVMFIAGLRADPRCRQIFAPATPDPIAQALRLVEADPSAQWTVARLARSVGMGRSNFAAHFAQQTGRAPMEVVAEQRMERAAALLRRGKLKIAEISELAGYGSEAAFSRRFTRHFGMSPSQMRDCARREDAAPGARPGGGFQPLLAGRLVKGAAAIGRRPAPCAIMLPMVAEAGAAPGGTAKLAMRGAKP